MQLLALPSGEPLPPPEPVAEPLPANLRAPVSPLVLASLPPRMLGAWPLEGDLKGNPYERMSGQVGALIGEGTRLTHGGKTVEFRPLPTGAIATPNWKGTSDDLRFNLRVGGYHQFGTVEELGLSERELFGDAVPAAGLFFADLEAEQWRARVRRNADLLGRMAECGPAGAYAKEALDAAAWEKP
jgi:hypothetical protein